MVFANLYSKLNELEGRINALSNGRSSGTASSGAEVDLSAINSKLEAHDASLAALPSEYASPQDVTALFEKLNQMTEILAQFGAQLNNVVERLNNVEGALRPPEDA
jgi:hypothetical protein